MGRCRPSRSRWLGRPTFQHRMVPKDNEDPAGSLRVCEQGGGDNSQVTVATDERVSAEWETFSSAPLPFEAFSPKRLFCSGGFPLHPYKEAGHTACTCVAKVHGFWGSSGSSSGGRGMSCQTAPLPFSCQTRRCRCRSKAVLVLAPFAAVSEASLLW